MSILTKYLTNKTMKKISTTILGKKIVKDCIEDGKAVYVAGDFNEEPHQEAVQLFVEGGFEILNNTERNANGQYIERTNPVRTQLIDLILGHNNNSNRKIIKRGIPEFIITNPSLNPSDHLPYFVKVKIK
jgi:endonuclease/exonuclease/phosphatase family metal-dependent hydrolase